MSRINPLYVVALLALLLLIVIYQHQKLERTITQKEHQLLLLQNKAKEIETLRRYWGDSKLQKRRVASLLSSPLLKRFIKNVERGSSRLKLFLHNVDAKSADQIMNKLLNSFVKVHLVKITKQDKTKIAMEVELQY